MGGKICGKKLVSFSVSLEKGPNMLFIMVLLYGRSYELVSFLYSLFCQSHFLYEVRDMLESRGCQLRIECEVHSVLNADAGKYLNSLDSSPIISLL
ncbi:hypothetical protein CRYUN_Cryun10bG0028800 [Craigia yunnanensis]